LTYGLARERLDSGCVFDDKAMFPLPKQARGTVRSLTVLNPLDEFVLRTYVGRCSGLSRRRRTGPGWFSADFRDQARKRRELQRDLYEAPETVGVGFFDVKDFFRLCRHDSLRSLLLDAGAPPGAVYTLATLLTTMFSTGHGLPIGFEGSGPLANMLLTPVDRALRQRGMRFVRWTDDLDVFLTDLDQWPELLGLVTRRLDDVGLAVNPQKTRMLPKGATAEERLLDPGRDSLFDGDAAANIADKLDEVLWLREQGMAEEIPPAHLRSYLGMLRRTGDPAALEFLQATAEWIDREPRAVGDYMSALAVNKGARKKLDLDWLVDLATRRPTTEHSAAGQLHLCRVLAHYRLPKDRAANLLEFAWRPEVLKKYAVLGAWSVRAWALSQGGGPRRRSTSSAPSLTSATAVRHSQGSNPAVLGALRQSSTRSRGLMLSSPLRSGSPLPRELGAPPVPGRRPSSMPPGRMGSGADRVTGGPRRR
jgi:Reverse transcriptase (RNA-dependent DNA polymerase)